MPPAFESLDDVLRRYGDPDCPLPEVTRVGLAQAFARGDDPLHVLGYLRGLGIPVHGLDDLLRINADPEEDEVRSFRVTEGVAVVVASHGAWVLFTP